MHCASIKSFIFNQFCIQINLVVILPQNEDIFNGMDLLWHVNGSINGGKYNNVHQRYKQIKHTICM